MMRLMRWFKALWILVRFWWLKRKRPPPSFRYMEDRELHSLARTGCRKCGSSGLAYRVGGVEVCWCVRSQHPFVRVADDGRPVMWVGN